jgi:hypothetical protein
MLTRIRLLQLAGQPVVNKMVILDLFMQDPIDLMVFR